MVPKCSVVPKCSNVACVIFVQTIFRKLKLIVKFHCASCCPGSDSIHLLLGL